MSEPMKPIIIIPEGAMKVDEIARLNANGLCVVEAKNPALVKFLDPIPSAVQRTKIEQAAIQLSRKLLAWAPYRDSRGSHEARLGHADVATMFVELLVQGTPLQEGSTQEEQDQDTFDIAKREELRRLAREEAKAERLAAKEKSQQERKDKKPA